MAQDKAELTKKIDQLITGYAENGLFNGSVLISLDGKQLIKKGYGYRNIETKQANTTATKFPIYSITKPMTATLVLQLVEKGQLKLDDVLAKFYPAIPGSDSITIKHLLAHTSGIYPYNNDFSMPTASEAAMINYLSGKQLRFKPGSKWEYCNTGYFLLGFIIRKITGEEFTSTMQNFIFRPAGMSNSGFQFRDSKLTGKATGYSFIFPDSIRKADLYPDEELRSAGSVWSTIEDLYQFHIALQKHQLLLGESKLGWFVDSLEGKNILSHSGGAAGFRSYLIRIPQINACIVLLANAENMDLVPLKDDLLQLLLGKSVALPISKPLEKIAAAKLAGVYQFNGGRWLYIHCAKNKIIAQISQQEPVLLLHIGKYQFSRPGLNGSIQFNPFLNDSVQLYRKTQRHTGLKVKASWGLVGTAMPNGWDGPDLELKPHETMRNTWIARNIILNDGVIKFRYNNDWTINLGSGTSPHRLKASGNNIPIRAGRYTITLTGHKRKQIYYFTYSIIPVR